MADAKRQYEHPNPQIAFHSPFNPRYVAAYRYQVSRPGVVAFTSSVQNAAYGSGSFTYDAA